MRYLIILLILIMGCSQRVPVSNTQENLLQHHNIERINKKIRPLELNNDLCEYAQNHAEKMAQKNILYHSKMSDLSKFCKKNNVAENIAWGQEDEKSVVNSWMWSPGHRWNILEEDYTNVGFGSAKDSKGRIYWCAVFSD